jgi:AcrR family transcriptional regulator
MKQRQIRLANIHYAAAEMFCRKGYDATTLGEIAEAVELTKAGLYHYFQSKEELLFSMVNFAMDRVQEVVIDPVREIEDPHQRLRAMTSNYVNLIIESGGYLTRAIEESNRLQRTRARKVARRRRAFYDFVRKSIQEAQDAGALPGINVSMATLSFFGIVLYMAEWYKPSGSLTKAEVADQIVRITVDRMLLGHGSQDF